MTTPTAQQAARDGNRPSRRRIRPATKAIAVLPPATVGSMIVCLPEAMPDTDCTADRIGRMLGLTVSLQPKFWAMPSLRHWQRSRMIDLHRGRPAYCAGGPARLINLAGMRHAAEFAAAMRFQSWQQMAHGTRPAQPWVNFLSRHLADPQELTFSQAVAEFYRQPRVSAMRISNAVEGPGFIAVGDLETLQAGCTAYQHYSAMTAVCGDALLSAEHGWLIPASDALADRVTYLEQALRHLNTVQGDQRLLALTVHQR